MVKVLYLDHRFLLFLPIPFFEHFLKLFFCLRNGKQQFNKYFDELKKDIEYASGIQGTPQKKQAVLYCRRLGIDYKKLTDVEFEVLIRVLQKSKLLRNPGGGQIRGKKRK